VAWSTSDRASRLPKGWAKIRRAAMDRDGWSCQWVRVDTGELCGAHASDCDHIIPGDDHSLTNLQALCSYHHRSKSSSEGRAAQDTDRAPGGRYSRLRAPQSHPGY
jgi:5-methylcytosine-specific restriction endonuclease McrA